MTESEAPAGAVSYREGDTPLTLPGLAVVATKLLGIYSFLSAIPHMAYAVMGAGGPVPLAEGLFHALPAASYIAAGIVLLFASEWVVARIVGVSRGGIPPTSIDVRLHAMAFSIVGVAFIVLGLAASAKVLANHLLIERHLIEVGLASHRNAVYGLVIEPFIQIVAGLLLFFRGRGLAALWHRMRYGGVRVGEVE